MAPVERLSVIIPVYNESRTLAPRVAPLSSGARIVRVLVAIVVASLLAPLPAHAYIDPLSGSIVFQVLIAGLLGALLTVRRWWGNAVRVVRMLLGRVTAR